MKVYPSHRYHPELGSKLVRSAEEDAALEGWYESPAEFGVETCPGRAPDPVIAAKRRTLEKPETLLEKVEEVLHIPAPTKRTRRVKS